MLLVGAISTLDPLKPAVVSFSKDLLHNIFVVSQAESENEVLKATIYGYMYVFKVDLDKQVNTVLAH